MLVVCRKCGVAFDPTHLQRCWFCDHPLSDDERDHLDRPSDPMHPSGEPFAWEADDSPRPRPAKAASA